MRHILPLALCSAAVVGLSIGAVSAHRHYVRAQDVRAQQAAAQREIAEREARYQQAMEAKVISERISRLQAECQKGLSAYAAVQKYAPSHAPVKPNCAV